MNMKSIQSGSNKCAATRIRRPRVQTKPKTQKRSALHMVNNDRKLVKNLIFSEMGLNRFKQDQSKYKLENFLKNV